MGLMLQSLLGVIAIPLIAWLLCEDRRALTAGDAARTIVAGLGLQVAIVGALLLVPGLREVFDLLGAGVEALQAATSAGMQLVFGYLAGGPPPFAVANAGNGFVLALHALPLILIVSVLSKLLYHWGILQRVVGGVAFVLRRVLGVSGSLGTTTAANIFVGMVEAPLFIKPYLGSMGRGALFATMTAGMASVAGTVMALYGVLLESKVPGAVGHIVAASIMSAPAALMISRLMVPNGFAEASEGTAMFDENAPTSTIDAIAQGTTEGLKLLAYVVAMLVTVVALVALANLILGGITGPLLGVKLTFERLLGWVAAPLAFLIGIPWSEAVAAGELIGVKTVLNEFVAYLRLGASDDATLSPRSRTILTYALCGFANFGSLGIMTGGLIAMCPQRRADILSLGPRTLVSGTLATLLTGAIVGAMTPG